MGRHWTSGILKDDFYFFLSDCRQRETWSQKYDQEKQNHPSVKIFPYKSSSQTELIASGLGRSISLWAEQLFLQQQKKWKKKCTFEFFAFTLRILPLWFDENATVIYLCKNYTTARGSPLNTSPCFKIYYNLAYRKGVVTV